MSIVVTGGAGFIGSCVVRTLNDRGINDIIIVDRISSTEKWLNLRNKKYITYVHKDHFLQTLSNYKDITAIIHMGACSATTESNFDYLWSNNFEYTQTLWNYAKEHQIQFLYASSAATYGDGTNGFDDTCDINMLLPLNGYGYSKHKFDLWVHEQDAFPLQYIGFKFFNVYGPNEYFKGSMSSMIYHGYRQIKKNGVIRLFKSGNPQYSDGGQLRDFVYIKDVCNVIIYMLEHPNINGLFNIGTGKSQSFNELAEAIFKALNIPSNIEYIDMPAQLKDKYQYYTKAEIGKLRDAGYQDDFNDLSLGVNDYVTKYLSNNFEIY